VVDRALVFAQGHILDAVQAVLDDPRPPLKGEEALRWSRLGRQAGDPLVHGLLALAVLAPGAPEAEALC
jgi:hypothetical protein